MLASAPQSGEGRRACDLLDRAEATLSQVRLVEPSTSLFGENAGDAFAIKVDPLVVGTVEPIGQVFKASRIEVANSLVDNDLAILEFQRR